MKFLTSSIEEYIDLLASSKLTPSGGSSLAVTGALGSSLVIMYCDISLKKVSDSGYIELLEEGREKAVLIKKDFEHFIERDAYVVREYLGTNSKDKKEKTGQEKSGQLRTSEDIAKELTLIPLLTAQRAREVLRLILSLQKNGHPAVEGDLLAGAYQASGAIFGSLTNVNENLKNISNKTFCTMIGNEAERIEKTSRDLIQKIEHIHHRVAVYDG
ncbi:cyclodeaminase/cyclohydrolase family protein [Natranaerobius trueperi]|uniref:Cyclodeaminase/cyclohydrolase domain-containing protein n=1 Tax=Natranaerobius trueperi TaxID=759412 RepID=A0A226C0X5_9FIRM|nr:cyclodeaminase/cyclohydrolase family protein [Natranaerobius trueperi]OWZ84913.1 hypothetical protein CDO51_00470 [Natranaerobius trueperi]